VNATRWGGAYALFRELAFSNVLAPRRQDACIKKRGDRCIPKRYARGWLEMMWGGKRVRLEGVEGLTARIQGPKDDDEFYHRRWKLL
jgi:hypothetical protein